LLFVGEALPSFGVPALVDVGQGVELGELQSSALLGSWSVLLYWPSDFGHVCPDLLDAVARAESAASQTRFLVATAGQAPEPLAQEWRRSVLRLAVPIAVDQRGELAAALGIAGADRRSARVTIVADGHGRVRWVNQSDISPKRDLHQALLVLGALRLEAPPEHLHVLDGSESLIAMCAWCRRVRDAGGWHSQEAYIRRRTGNDFTHGICRDCMGGFTGA
jgi:alkyl hydroperoxide reductase subunit AhpC